MPAIRIIEKAFQRLAHAVTARWPRSMPAPARLRQCKLISHRGDHGPGSGEENTLDAFQTSADAGVWGVEFDVRWTCDGVPVVVHDPDLMRLHGTHRTIASLHFDTLQRRYPAIPALEQVGTGFVDSRMGLLREIHRGIAWIFSNKAAELQSWIDGNTPSHPAPTPNA